MQVNEHYWVLVMEPKENNRSYKGTQYWGSKKSFGRWVSDISQATHYPTLKAAKSKIGYVTNFFKKVSWGDVQVGFDKIFIMEANSTVTLTEIQ
jgi:hypothetical protein